eukprot:tig00000900_g5378.t1
MGSDALSTLVPTRFLVLTGHLILTIMIAFNRADNVKTGLPPTFSQDDFNRDDTSITVALALSYFCFFIEYVGLFGGFTMFTTTVSLFEILCHLVGLFFGTMFIVDTWASVWYWYIFGFTCAFPALVEATVISAIVCCKLVYY